MATPPDAPSSEASLEKPPQRSLWQRLKWLILALAAIIVVVVVVLLAVLLTRAKNAASADSGNTSSSISYTPSSTNTPSPQSSAIVVSGSNATIGTRPVKGSPDYVELDYAKYRGVAGSNGISVWLGMRYAEPPTGDLRFQAPVSPANQGTDAILVNKFGPACLAVDGGPPSEKHSEDCLLINVFAPTKATNSSTKLPVFFGIQGGGFSVDASPYLDGTNLIKAANESIIVVTFNYRVGPYGFLSGEEVQSQGSSNNGIKDQFKALEWTKKYISEFGGDPDHIVIGGGSAGAQSIAMILTANGGSGDPMFAGVAAQSVSSPMLLDVEGSQFIYDALVQRTRCRGDTFKCLQQLDAAELQKVNSRVKDPSAKGVPVFTYSPVVDGTLVPDYTYNLFNQGKFHKVPTIMGDDQNGGTSFAPYSANSYSATDTFLRNNFVLINDTELADLKSLYTIDDFPDKYEKTGGFFRQAAAVYGDMRYKCPGLSFSSSIAAAGAKSWAYRYSVVDPHQESIGLGTPHMAEVGAIWGPSNGAPRSYDPGESNADIVPEMQAYWSSFIRTLDPNTHKRPQDPTWTQWDSTDRKYINFKTHDTAMESQSAIEAKRCSYIDSIAPGLHQ